MFVIWVYIWVCYIFTCIQNLYLADVSGIIILSRRNKRYMMAVLNAHNCAKLQILLLLVVNSRAAIK